MTSKLFTPLRIGPIEIPNRVVVSPMCQYSAIDGSLTDWHLQHLGSLALSGAGQLTIEATHVSQEGRITHGCSGLYSDDNEAALQRVVQFCRGVSSIKIGLQLAHAGRKGSAKLPWQGRGPLSSHAGAWTTLAPSPIPLDSGWPEPTAMDASHMQAVKGAFIGAARRAARIDFDSLELHSAHGYLLNEFLSPLANKRTDEYGGTLESRMRFPLQVFAAVREAWPLDRALGAKIPGSDFMPEGWTPEDAVVYARALKDRGCDYVIVSGGGVVLDAKPPHTPGYQVPFAAKVKRETGLVTGAVGMISDPLHAESVIAEGSADFVALARAFLFNPRWPWHAAIALGVDIEYPPQYERCHPRAWRNTGATPR